MAKDRVEQVGLITLVRGLLVDHLRDHRRRKARHACEFCKRPTSVAPSPDAKLPIPAFCANCVDDATARVYERFAALPPRPTPGLAELN